jgi:predicted transcriptional regulator of viral defense system
VDLLIAEMAARQHGVVTVAQLLAVGLTTKMIEWRVAVGHLHRLHHGVHAVGHVSVTREGRWLAAVFACGEGAVLSHRSAAALWSVRETASALIEVSSPTSAGRSRNGIRVHSGAALHSADTTTRRGIPCTSLSRTILDCAALLHPEALDYMVHRAQSKDLYDPAEMDALLRRSRGRRGVARLRLVLGVLDETGDAQANAGAERVFLRLCRRFHLPIPSVSAWVPLPIAAAGLEVDFTWPAHMLAVEVDSRRHHMTDRAFQRDRERDRALTAAGWRVLRFTWRDLTEAPAQVAAELRAHLAHPLRRRAAEYPLDRGKTGSSARLGGIR